MRKLVTLGYLEHTGSEAATQSITLLTQPRGAADEEPHEWARDEEQLERTVAGRKATVWVKRAPAGFRLRVLFPQVRVEISASGLEVERPERLLDQLEQL